MPVDAMISTILLPWLVAPMDPTAATGRVHPPVVPVRVVAPYRPPPEPWERGHRGIDLVARAGQQVRAPVGGRVAFAGDVAGRPVVTLTIASGRRLTFEPVRTGLSEGDRVLAGSLLGHIDPTGPHASHCGGPDPCLHVGLRTMDGYRDPRPFVLGTPVLKPTARMPRVRGPQDAESSLTARGWACT